MSTRLIAILFLLFFAAVHVFAQAKCPRPSYSGFRFDEDWSFLAEPECRTDPFDPIKYVGLGKDHWFVSLGGEARLRYENYENPGFGSDPKDENGYLLQRYLFHIDWHIGSRVRVFSQFQSGIESGRNGGPRLTDENLADVHQLFLDTKVTEHLTLRVGRQELEFASGRLIGASEGLNVRRAFDGARLSWQSSHYVWNLVYARPVLIRARGFDVPDHAQTMWGTGLTKIKTDGGIAGYYVALARKRVLYAQGAGREMRHTIGSRIWRTGDVEDHNIDIIFQTGTFNHATVVAGAISSDWGLTLRARPLKPRLGLRADYSSGDTNPADASLQTFNPLFPNPTYSSRSTLLGPSNLTSATPNVTFTLPMAFRLTLEAPLLWRSSTKDSIYNFAGIPVRPALKSTARFVGSQIGAQLDKSVTRHMDINLSYFRFLPGTYLRQSPPDQETGYFSAWIRYRF